MTVLRLVFFCVITFVNKNIFKVKKIYGKLSLGHTLSFSMLLRKVWSLFLRVECRNVEHVLRSTSRVIITTSLGDSVFHFTMTRGERKTAAF